MLYDIIIIFIDKSRSQSYRHQGTYIFTKYYIGYYKYGKWDAKNILFKIGL